MGSWSPLLPPGQQPYPSPSLLTTRILRHCHGHGNFWCGTFILPRTFLGRQKSQDGNEAPHSQHLFTKPALASLLRFQGFCPQITVSSLLFHNQNLLQLSHFFLQGLSSDLITFSVHSLISESFLPRTPVWTCLPHIFSFSLQNTEHDIPWCAQVSPCLFCFILGRFGLQLHLQYLGEHPRGPCSVPALGGELPSQLRAPATDSLLIL